MVVRVVFPTSHQLSLRNPVLRISELFICACRSQHTEAPALVLLGALALPTGEKGG